MKRLVFFSLGLLLAGLTLGTCTATAQGFGGRGGGPGQRPGDFDPEQMRARMAEMMKERLNATDEEWKIIEPRLTAVQEKQRASMGGRFGGMGMFGRGRDRGADDAQRPPRDTREGMTEMQALRDALDNDSTPASELKAKMKAVRESRAKNEAELKTAREQLREVLTTRQEAVCLMMGMLD